MNKKPSLERTAYHEAGHAVMMILLKLPFETVSLSKTKTTHHGFEDGRATHTLLIHTEGVQFSEQRLRAINDNILAGMLNLREAITGIAGPQAEAMFVGEIDEDSITGARGAVGGIKYCCRAAISGKPVESLTAAEIEGWSPTEMEKGILDALVLQAEKLLNDNWTSVEAVASLLLQREHLTFSEVRDLVETHAATKGR